MKQNVREDRRGSEEEGRRREGEGRRGGEEERERGGEEWGRRERSNHKSLVFNHLPFMSTQTHTTQNQYVNVLHTCSTNKSHMTHIYIYQCVAYK